MNRLFIENRFNRFLKEEETPINKQILNMKSNKDGFTYNYVDLCLEEQKLTFIPNKYINDQEVIIDIITQTLTYDTHFYTIFSRAFGINFTKENVFRGRHFDVNTKFKYIGFICHGEDPHFKLHHPDLDFHLLYNEDVKKYIVAYNEWTYRTAFTHIKRETPIQSVKPGRFVKSLGFTDRQAEEFNNSIISYIKRIQNIEKFIEIVEGEDIRHFYNLSNYSRVESILGNSCMRYDECVKYFDLYVNNPDVCKMVILKNDKDLTKIDGRALLWTLDDGTLYMDRIYTVNDVIFNVMNDWGKKKGYKMYNRNTTTTKTLTFNSNISYTSYPYMDTFRYMLNLVKDGKGKTVFSNIYSKSVISDSIKNGYVGYYASLDSTKGYLNIIERF